MESKRIQAAKMTSYARSGNLDGIRQCIQNGANLNFQDDAVSVVLLKSPLVSVALLQYSSVYVT